MILPKLGLGLYLLVDSYCIRFNKLSFYLIFVVSSRAMLIRISGSASHIINGKSVIMTTH